MSEPKKISANPFVGLRPFNSDEAILFFGRNNQTTQLLEKLYQQRFLAIVGSSGCGKSSLVRAGLIPKLKAGMLVGDRDRWYISVMKPGDRPMQNLLRSLNDTLKLKLTDYTTMSNQEEWGAQDIVSSIIPTLEENDTNLLILVDQFEEIFRYDKAMNDEDFQEQAMDFVAIILSLTEQLVLPVYIVLTMRSDFLGECDRFRGLPEAINKSIYLVPRLNRRQHSEAIEGPIRLFGQIISGRLLNRLLNDIGDESDQLPVLQHVLMSMWDNWRSNNSEIIDLKNYIAVGTLDKALSQDAEKALSGFDENELRLVEQVFKALTDTDQGNRQVRNPIHLKEIAAITESDVDTIQRLIKKFHTGGRSFLVVSDSEKGEDPIIDISHESLIRQWDRLSQWVTNEAEARSVYLRLVDSALRYEKGKTGLWRNPELQIGLDWKEEIQPNEAWGKRYSIHFKKAIDFLEKSQKAKEKDEILRKRKMIVSILIGFLVVIAISFGINWYRQREADQELKLAIIENEKLLEQQQRERAQQDLKISNMGEEADSIVYLADNALSSEDVSLAKSYYKNALDIFSQLRDTRSCALVLISLGKVNILSNDLDSATFYFDMALDSILKIGDKKIEGTLYEQMASMSDKIGKTTIAEKYYAMAQNLFANSGEYFDNGRILEKIAIKEEEVQNYGKAIETYKESLKSYTISGDQFAISRVKTAIEKIASIYGSWGYLLDLHNGEIYQLTGNSINIGRSTQTIKNDINFSNKLISRRHVSINRNLIMDDQRSRNGTSINGLLLRYGMGVSVSHRDIITLADVKALQFFKTEPIPFNIPLNAWAILVDNETKSYQYLTVSSYGLRINGKTIQVIPGNPANIHQKIRFQNGEVEVFEIEDSWTALFEFKETDYEYTTYLMEDGEWVQLLSRPIWYARLTADNSRIIERGPSLQIVLLK